MKKKLSRMLTVGAAAVGAVALATGPAFAGSVGANVYGAQGSGTFRYDGHYIAPQIYLTVADTNKDGHSVGIRVQSLTPDRKVTSYSWHKVYTGASTEQTWPTSLQDNRGIWALRVQVCVFEGDRTLGCDESSWDGNPNY
ncbi:hypothetical protein [Streptomyces sp. NPDC001135]